MVRNGGRRGERRGFLERKPGKELYKGVRKKNIVEAAASVMLIAFALFIVSPVMIVAVRAFSEGTKPFVDFYIWKPAYLRGLANSLVISL